MPGWLETALDQVRGLGWWEILVTALLVGLTLQLLISSVVLWLTRRTKTTLDDDAARALRWPLFLTVIFVGIVYAARDLGLGLDGAHAWFARLLQSLAIFIWIRALMRIGDSLLDPLARRVDEFRWIEPRSLPLYEIATKLALLSSAAYALFLTWDLNVAGWLASAGIMGIAIGFAAKDTLANLFAGIFILADAPYKLGDFIVLESGERGKVTDIGIRSTRILTRDDIEITLPNGVMANSKIMNESSGPHVKRRLRVNVGVAYGSDVDRVREVMMEAAARCSLLSTELPPSVRFRSFGDSALMFQLRGFIDHPVMHGRAVDQVCTAIYKHFTEADIEIPFPQRVLHMQSTPA